jgi:hypothetical protein
MNAQFRCAVLDSLLPAENEPSASKSALPSGAAVDIDLDRYPEAAAPVLQMIAQAAGGTHSFLAASPEARVAIIRQVQQAAPAVLQALLAVLLPDYYESPAVLEALGWRADPPQPAGHALDDMDDATREALERVRARGKLWRE